MCLYSITSFVCYYVLLVYGTDSNKNEPLDTVYKCYTFESRKLLHNNAIDFLFLTLHTTPFLYEKMYFILDLAVAQCHCYKVQNPMGFIHKFMHVEESCRY